MGSLMSAHDARRPIGRGNRRSQSARMFAIILDGRVLTDDPKGVYAIIVSDNLDNEQNLPEHEMALLMHARSTAVGIFSSSADAVQARMRGVTAVAPHASFFYEWLGCQA